MTEHVSFIPSNILNVCHVLGIQRPHKKEYEKIVLEKKMNELQKNNSLTMLEMIDTDNILNIKELNSFSEIKTQNDIPKDIFNIICNQIIDDINNHEGHDFLKFRDSLYDILVYNLDMTECLFYILSHFIETDKLQQSDISDIMIKSYSFLKYYNNNYRPIYHLESIMYYIIIKINGYK
jgi:predicted XRE-type DNA-binding protein